MPDLLIRDVPDEIKRQLAIRAAENGRSQSAEALSILGDCLVPAKKTWLDMLLETVEEAGPVELELPERAQGRELPFDWLVEAR